MARGKVISQEEALFNQAVGKHLEVLRKRAGMTQKKLALDIGVRQQTLQAIESGSTRCSAYLMSKIARRLGIPVAALMRGLNLTVSVAER